LEFQKKKENKMATKITDTQTITGTASFTDTVGNPVTTFATVPVWASSDTSVLEVVGSADGLTGTATATGKLGTAQVSVTEGGIVLLGDVEVVAGAAVAGSVSFAAATEK